MNGFIIGTIDGDNLFIETRIFEKNDAGMTMTIYENNRFKSQERII